jgi:O-methyltransferase
MPGGNAVQINSQNLLYETDQFFNDKYDEGIAVSGTPLDNDKVYYTKRRVRFYNTMQLFLQSIELEGAMIECGCFRGLSSFMMCGYLKALHPKFSGKDFFIVDSFEGLSEPTKEDDLEQGANQNPRFFAGAGTFATSMDHVRNVLLGFPEVQLYKGWIPEVLQDLPDVKYRFVHIDVDLYQPIKAALEYFHARLVPGGMIVIDDYGSLFWPGAKLAVEEFCSTNCVQFLKISTAQAVIWRR